MALEDVVKVGGGVNQQSAAAAKWSRKGKAVEEKQQLIASAL